MVLAGRLAALEQCVLLGGEGLREEVGGELVVGDRGLLLPQVILIL